jgi:glycosyltransferase involved in cell wall biosynthesis
MSGRRKSNLMTPIPPLVSVILPCFKMGRYVGDALASIKAQTYSNWEVIAVDDDGPDDGTREAVTKLAVEVPSRRIEYIRHAKNRGQGAARNTGMGVAKGELFAFLDPDDYWPPGYLEAQVEAFATGDRIDMAFTGTLKVGPKGEPIGPWMPSDSFVAHLPASFFVTNHVIPSAVMVRASAIRAEGGFDEEPMIVEDWDMWIRLALKGCVFRLSEAPPIFYRRHEEADSVPGPKFRIKSRAVRVKHGLNPRVIDAIEDTLETLEKNLAQSHAAYQRLAHAYRGTWDYRFKEAVRKLIGRLRGRI